MIICQDQSKSASSPRRLRDCARAFTLLEVVLAIVIALGILMVLLYFYQQATTLRAQAIQKTEQIAAARLLLERLTTELRSARPSPDTAGSFLGTSNSIEFIKSEVPSFASWTGGTLGRSLFPNSDLKRIRYELASSLDDTNVMGLLRSEQPLVTLRETISDNDFDGQFDNNTSTNSVARPGQSPVIQEIQYLQFRYWSGTNWVDSWSLSGLPSGVEVSLGPEPATNETENAEYTGELFRRVIYLPGASRAASVAFAARTNDSSSVLEDAP